MRTYSKLDLLRYHKLASRKENKLKRPIDLLKQYDIENPPLTKEQMMNNLIKALKLKGYKGITKP